MPEGDAVHRTAARLHGALAGEPLTVTDLRWAHVATVDLTGRTTLEVVARGKHILHRVSGGVTIHSHLRMDGRWRVVDSASLHGRLPRDHRVRAVVATRAWTCIGRSLGELDVLPTEREDGLLGHLGPDLLGPDWDTGTAVDNLHRRPQTPIGEALLDQRNLAGIGTMYAAEALFLERMHPWTPVGRLGDGDAERVTLRAKRLLEAGLRDRRGGTTGRGPAGPEHWAYGRSGRACLRCGDTIRIASIGSGTTERVMFSCPTCQGGIGPGDDGRLQRPLGAGDTPGRPGGGRSRGPRRR